MVRDENVNELQTVLQGQSEPSSHDLPLQQTTHPLQDVCGLCEMAFEG